MKLITAVGIAVATFAIVQIFDEPKAPRPKPKFNPEIECRGQMHEITLKKVKFPDSYKTLGTDISKIDDSNYALVNTFTSKNALGITVKHKTFATCKVNGKSVKIVKHSIK